MRSKIIMGLFALMLLISLASADWTIDNIKDYDIQTNTVTVDNLWGIGDTILQFKRTTPNPNPVIRSASRDKKDWRPVVCYENLYLDYTKDLNEIFTDQEFYDLKLGEISEDTKFIRDYEYRVAYQVPYKEPTYNIECPKGESLFDDKGFYNDKCISTQNGTITKYKKEYKPIEDLNDIRLNDEFCLFTYVAPNEYGEQIPTLAGKRTPEFSEWNDSIETNLLAWWKFDGDATDALGNSSYDGVASNPAVWGQAGIIGESLDLGSAYTVNVSHSGALQPENVSISLWYKADSYVNNAGIMVKGTNWPALSIFTATAGMFSRPGTGDYVSYGNTDTTNWNHLVVTYEHFAGGATGTTGKIYFNGALVDTDTSMPAVATNTKQLVFGYAFTNYYDGKIDEVGFWNNRILTLDEVEQLYNGGTGITYTPSTPSDSPPTVSLTIPANATLTSNPNIIFNWSVSDDINITNSTLYINGIENATYPFGTGNETTFQVTMNGLADGSYNWTATAYDNSSQQANTTTNFFTIDTTNPSVTITELGRINYHKRYDNLTINYSISDTNIDSCLMEYAGINSSLNCSANGKYINVTSTGYKIVTIYANDTLANSNSSNMNWSYNIFENSRTFTASTTQTTLESYTLNITLGPSVTLSSGALVWNGTSYAASITAIGSNRNLSRELTIPSVSGSVNVTFYWSLTTSEGVINTTSSTQEIKEIDIDDCTTNTNQILNYSVYDEDTRSFLTNTTWNNSADIYIRLGADFSGENYQEYSTTSGANPIKICLSNAIAAGENYRLDSIVKFGTADHVTEYHYLENVTLNSSSVPKNIALYDLATNNSQEFLITFKDSNFIPLEGAIIQITRQYLSLGQFLTIESVKTDSDGKTIGHFVLNDEVYTIYVKKNGVLRAVFQNVRTFCSNILTGDCQIILNEQSSTANPSSFKDYLGVIGTESYNDTSKIYQFSFTTSDGSSKTINVSVYKYDLLLNTTICSEELTDSSGTISCTIPAAYYNNTALVKIFVDGEAYSSNTFYVTISKSSQQNPTRFILAFLLVITLPFLAFTSGPMALVLFIVGLILVAGLFLIDFGGYIGAFSSFMWFVIAAIILLIKASKRRQQ